MGLTVRADIIENRLYFKLSGEFAKGELDKVYTDVTFLVVDISSGPNGIAGISDCHNGQKNDQSIKKNSNYLVTNGLGEIIRITNGDSLLHDQDRYLSSVSSPIIPVYAQTHEETKERLESSIKRNGIRFYVNNIPIEYSNYNFCGTGNLVNISTGGCSVEAITLPLSVGEEFLMQITFNNQDLIHDKFQVNAKVIKVANNSFAAKFNGLTDDQKLQLWKCVVYGAFRGV